MTWRHADILDKIRSARSIEDIRKVIRDIRSAIDLDHVVYHSLTGENAAERSATTYSDAWIARYQEQEYHSVDPVVRTSLRAHGLVDWRHLDWTSPKARNFLGEARDAGIPSQGISMPIRGPNGALGLFTACASVSDLGWDALIRENEASLMVIGAVLDQKLWDMSHAGQIGQDGGHPPSSLSPRERDTLRLLAMGHKRGEAAERLRISDNTLRSYIDSARDKLGAENTVHAVAIALASGLIVL